MDRLVPAYEKRLKALGLKPRRLFGLEWKLDDDYSDVLKVFRERGKPVPKFPKQIPNPSHKEQCFQIGSDFFVLIHLYFRDPRVLIVPKSELEKQKKLSARREKYRKALQRRKTPWPLNKIYDSLQIFPDESGLAEMKLKKLAHGDVPKLGWIEAYVSTEDLKSADESLILILGRGKKWTERQRYWASTNAATIALAMWPDFSAPMEPRLSLSESGLQGGRYVSFDVGKELTAWIRRQSKT